MNCGDPPNLAWTQQDLYTPQPTKEETKNKFQKKNKEIYLSLTLPPSLSLSLSLVYARVFYYIYL